MNYERLGKRIREERQKLGLTQARLAEDVDISDTYIGQIERGERSLTLGTLVRLSNRLGVTIDYLLMDSVESTDEAVIDQFRRIISGRSAEKKQMAIDVVKTIFIHLDNEQQ